VPAGDNWGLRVAATLQQLTLEELTAVNGVGAVVGESIVRYFSHPTTATALDDLIAVGVELTPPAGAPASGGSGPLSGELVVVTGTLVASGLSRREAQERIRAAGGAVADAVTSKTTLLVAGERAGSKRAEAERLGIRIVDDAGFLALLGESASGG